MSPCPPESTCWIRLTQELNHNGSLKIPTILLPTFQSPKPLSMALSTVLSPNPPLKSPLKFKPTFLNPCFNASSQVQTIPVNDSVIRTNPFKLEYTRFLGNSFGFGIPFHHNRKFGFVVKAGKDGEMDKESVSDKAEEEAWGQSTMPDKFRPLTKEAPYKPVRWPWFIGTFKIQSSRNKFVKVCVFFPGNYSAKRIGVSCTL